MDFACKKFYPMMVFKNYLLNKRKQIGKQLSLFRLVWKINTVSVNIQLFNFLHQ